MSFEAGDIISQVMSFGSPTPIQIDVQGVDIEQDYAYLAKVEAELRKLNFLRDISIVQPHLYPTVEVTGEPRLCRAVRSDDGGRDATPSRLRRVPLDSLRRTTGAIPGPAMHSRSRCSYPRTGCKVWARFLRCR